MGFFVCNICQKEFDELKSLKYHLLKNHGVKGEQIFIDYELNGIKPTCECGCGELPSFISINKGFSRFIRSHHNRVKGKNNFHKNPITHQKAIETQKKNWKEGKYVGWWEDRSEETLNKIEGIKDKLRNNKERGKKISDKLKGIPKSEEIKKKVSESQKKRYSENPEIREKMSIIRLEWMRKNSKVKTSKLEIEFKKILLSLNLKEDVDIIYNHLVHKINTFFDFYFPKKNIIIEVDGDFYHCNPNSDYSEPTYEIQKKNMVNDKRKNSWCSNHGITLIRYWEKDINERPEWVIEDLKNKLNIK